MGGMWNLSRNDKEADTLWTTPWAWRDEDGMYVGHNGNDVWLYRMLELSPMMWEDPSRKLDIGSVLASLLYDLAATSKDLGVGFRSLSKPRQIHLLSCTWDVPAEPPAGTPDGLQEFLKATLDFDIPQKTVVVGVKLWQKANSDQGVKGLLKQARNLTNTVLDESSPDFSAYDADRRAVKEILARNGATKPPSLPVRKRMEAWYSNEGHPDAALYETRDCLLTSDGGRIEMAAVMSFDKPMFSAPNAPWAFIANNHFEGASVISVRADLEPPSISRNRVRRAQRKVLSQMEEEQATGDIERAENYQTLELAQTVENLILNGSEPLLTNCSIIMARRVSSEEPETYMDVLSSRLGIEMKPLEHRQLSALDETLPCSVKRVNPFLQDISVAMLAYAGMQAFSNIGDRKGAFLGLVDPDFGPCYIDPLGAPAANLPPGMLIAGEPGSGKTFTAQLIALQSALAGLRTVFINPKADDTLEGLTDLVDGNVVRLSAVESQGGFFDPFRFCRDDQAGRNIAADILSQHILAVLGSRGVAGQGLNQVEEIAVIAGLRAGADAGARCAAQAISFIEDPAIKELIAKQASDPLFRLGIGMQPAESYASQTSGNLLLIEFDKPLDIPEKGVSPAEYTRSQRLAVAAVRLVTRASMEMLANSSGGTIIVDEAWMFLQSSEGLAALQSFGRLGRSKNILPIFATQRIDDLLRTGVDMQSYLSRVLCMKLTDPAEAAAALQLCGLQVTPERIDWLRSCGAKYTEEGRLVRGAMGLHKDLDDRHAAVMIGPIPEHARAAFSTNPEERRKRKAQKEAAALSPDRPTSL